MTVFGILLRRSSAVVAAPVLILLGWLAGARDETFWSVDWGLASGHTQEAGLLLVPATAAAAAWDASRNRRVGADQLMRTYPRSPLAQLTVPGLVPLCCGLLGFATALLTVALKVTGGGKPYWSIIVTGTLCLAVATALGVLAGRLLPPFVAAPAVAVGIWFCLAYGSISGNPLVARLSVINVDCCAVNTEPVLITVAGQWLWLLALLLAAVAVLAWPRRLISLSAVVIAAIALTSGLSALISTQSQLTAPRPLDEAVCKSSQGATVCMWPDHAADVDRWLPAVIQFRTTFAELGPLPQRYVEFDAGRRSPSDAPIGWIRHGESTKDLLRQLAMGLLPDPPACAMTGPASSGPFPGAAARNFLHAWLVKQITPSVPTGDLTTSSEAKAFDRLLTLPRREQLDWVQRARSAQRDCATTAPVIP